MGQSRTGLGRLEARGSDKRSFSAARAERNSLVTIESRFPPHGGLGLSVPLLAFCRITYIAAARLSPIIHRVRVPVVHADIDCH